MTRSGWPNYTFPFRESDEIVLSRIAKHTGLTPDDL